jgi:hypothetical protein
MNGDTVSTNRQQKDQNDSTKKLDATSEPPYPKIQKTNSWLIKNKLSPEFDNVKDEAELGNLMGIDGEKLLNLVDDIRKIDKLRDIELDIPQVILIVILSKL